MSDLKHPPNPARSRLGPFEVGRGLPALVIAEAGVNHNGDPELARRLIDVAAASGADVVKFQTFTAERVASVAAPKAAYQRDTTDPGESQLELLRTLELAGPTLRELTVYAASRGIAFASTPFDHEAIDLLVDLGVPFLKVPSGEITNRPFLEHVGSTGLPVVLSTGMSYLQEVLEAIGALAGAGAGDLAILQCVSNYPAAAPDVNLRAMATLEAATGLPVGFSDHTSGLSIPFAAVALGACIIEKHFTLDRRLPGPDHRASIEPAELEALVNGIRDVEASLGDGVKQPVAAEADTRLVARRSLAAASAIAPGTVLTSAMLDALRPSTGLSPMVIGQVLGRRATRPIAAGQLIDWSDLE
ncbi:MAG: N-acetylneuraminate synthase [Vicinamibacterales bacterium]